MDAVWNESSSQAREMIETLTQQPKTPATDSCSNGETNGTIEGLRTIAINVIGLAGYGNRQKWAQAASSAKPPPNHKLTFMEALLAIVNNHIIAVFVPAKLLSLRCWPRAIQNLGHAITEFPHYAEEMIARERNSSRSNTLLGALVKVADESKKGSLPFSEAEIMGNLFNFTLAGFDTTASTMAYAIMSLALQPELQDWIIEEIDAVAALHPDAEYESTFPLLVRCLALMVRTHALLLLTTFVNRKHACIIKR